MLDYADLLKFSQKKETHEELGYLYELLRGLAKEMKCVMYTVAQNNRTGYSAETASLNDIAASFSRTFICDLVRMFV